MWNFYNNWRFTDDLDVKSFEADTGSIAADAAMEVERHFIIDRFRRLNYVGRMHVDPKPLWESKEGFRYKESLHPILEPFDLKGLGGTFYRYIDPARQDDSWLYLPQLRRVRRLSTAQRSDALFGQDSDIDSYFGYNGHIAWMNFRLLGERVLAGSIHSRNTPVKWQQPSNWAFDDVWEPRTVWAVEAISKLPQYSYGKRVIFIDKEGWIVSSSDIYDRAGQLWKVWVNMYTFAKRDTPRSPIIYPDEMPFTHAVVILDTQLQHATKLALPSVHSAAAETTHFLNQGRAREEHFTIARLISGGH